MISQNLISLLVTGDFNARNFSWWKNDCVNREGNEIIPVIPPTLVNKNLVTNFKDKAKIFIDFFSKECQPIPNNSTLPSIQSFETSNRLSTVVIDSKKILKLIQGLNSNKAHGHDGISIRTLKLCGPSVKKPLSLLFNNCLTDGVFPKDWKKADVFPVHEKGNKRLVSNYRPVSLLSIFSKIFEKLIDCIYYFLDQHCLLKANQSGFRPGDSCIHQLIAITCNIFTAFDANPSLEVHDIFLHLSKPFDRVWHKGLIHKLRIIGIDGKLLSLIESFFHHRYQRVVLNGQSSK